ncbi:hypothetical protein CPB84DRAFT_1848568 [Gymnopilus junonius]|uniref:Uncharacterized protein n=1 Tax=Gymnopilus junonius TaxID=109634 RepID=A0A9P5TKS5_GYMJU|nr:hypothetical protein CPB84DRAFT_1848568 [Gymnopilus junonius]
MNFFRDEPRPRLSLPTINPNHQQSRPPLENKHLNVNQDQPNPRLLLFSSQNAPRFSLSGLKSNTPRLSTPVQLRVQYHPSQAMQDEERENSASSPLMRPPASPERAYTQSNRRISPPPASKRLSLLQFSQAKHGITQTTPSLLPRSSPSEVEFDALSTLASEHRRLYSEKEKFSLICKQSTQELEDCRARLASSARDLKALIPKESVVAKETELSSVKSSLSEIRNELTHVKEEHATVLEERNELKGKRSFEKDTGRRKGQNSDVDEQKLAKNGLAAVQPLLDDQNTLARAGETKVILKELQEDLASSHQVNDLLRDKLHVSGSQLIDAHGRIRELEEEKHGALKDLLSAREEEKRQFELLIAVEGKVAVLSDRLSERERETFDILADAAVLDADLKAARASKIETLKSAQEVQVPELQALRVVKEEHLSKLLALQDIINAREKEVIHLKGEVKALNESKAELRALLAESKKELAQKSTELQERNPNEELMAKVRDLETKKEALASSLKEVEQRHAALQKTSRDQEAAFRVNTQAVEKSNAELSSSNVMLSKTLEKTQASLATALVASGKCQALEDEIAQLNGRLNVQSVSLFQSKEEASTLKERVNSLTSQLRLAQDASEEAVHLRERVNALSLQLKTSQSALTKSEADNESLAKAQEKRASAAEATATFLQSQLVDTNQSLADMKANVSELTCELSAMKEASVIFETENETMAHVQKESEEAVRKFEKFVAELKRENERLRNETDAEKELVKRLLDDSRRIHEEDVVRKDNELRRRQHVVDSLKAKVAELQGTIARMIKEKDTELQVVPAATTSSNSKPIVGLKPWMPSSSPRMEIDATIEEQENTHQKSASVASVKITIPPATRKAPPVNLLLADPRLSQLRAADSDDDDDKPLSELSRLSELEDGSENLIKDEVGFPSWRAVSKRRVGTNPATKPLNGQEHNTSDTQLGSLGCGPERDQEGDNEELVQTPAGLVPKSNVFAVPQGARIQQSPTEIQIIGANGTVLHSVPYTDSKTANVLQRPTSTATSRRELQSGYIAYTYWDYTGSSPISFFGTNWIVPPTPSSWDGQLLYLWNGLVPNDFSAILQPVLQYGASPAGGGEYYSIASWWLIGDYVYYTDVTQVQPGTFLQGHINLTGTSDSGGATLYSYTSTFVGYPNSTISASTIGVLNWAYEALEIYTTESTSDLPAGNSVFSTIDITFQNGQNPSSIPWTAVSDPTDGITMTVLSTSGTIGSLLLTY